MKILIRSLGFIFALFFFSVHHIHAQDTRVRVSPEFPTIDEEITLTFDVKEMTDSRAEGLLGLTDDVYLWSGAGDDDDAFRFGPPGQDNFGVPFEPGTMTFLGNDVWEITFVPRDYYNIPQGTEITQLGVLLKNGNGQAQTEDLFVPINPGTFVAIEDPRDEVLFAKINDQIDINIRSSSEGDLEIFVDDGSGFVSIASATGVSELSGSYTVTTPGPFTLNVRAEGDLTTGMEQSLREYTVFTVSDSETETRPAGIVDGINYGADDTRVTLSLLAPNKEWVYVTGDFNNWEIDDAYRMKRDGEHFWLELTGLTPGQEYAFAYAVNDVTGGTSAVFVGDPWTDIVLDKFNDGFIPEENYPNIPPSSQIPYDVLASVLQTAQTPYPWGPGEDSWVQPEEEDLAIYELLVRDFVGSGRYQDVIDSLDYLAGLGINAIELMPIMEFGGNDSWGYNPDYFFAPDKFYGTKDDLKRFIEACHERGIAVILDMVLNHADRHPFSLMYYDRNLNQPRPDNPWFNETAPHPFSVFQDFNHESQYTKDLVDTVNLYWLREYHFDGYRFDLTKGFTQNVGGSTSDNSAYDQSRIDILTRMANVIWAEFPDAYVILEHFAEPAEENVLGADGMFMWGSSKFAYQDIMAANPVNSSISDAANPIKVTYMESHDEDRLVYDALTRGTSSGSYDIRSEAVAIARAKMAPAYSFTLPGPKMMWQFGELGYDIDINLNGRTGRKPLPWGPDGLGYYEDPERQKIYGVYAAIISLTQEYREVFKNGTLDISRINEQVKRIAIEHGTMDVVILGNWSTTEQTIDPDFTQDGDWYDFFSGDTITISDVNEERLFYPGEWHIYTTLRLPTPEGELVDNPDPPTLEAIADQSTNENTPTDPITVVIVPGSVPAEDVTLRGESSLPVVANSDIVFSGTGDTRSMVITPRQNLFGETVITVYASDGTFETSTSFNLVVNEVVTGIEDKQLSRDVSIYPNPSSGQFILEIDPNTIRPLDVEIYDLAGRRQMDMRLFENKQSNAANINLGGIEAGVYLIRVDDGDGQFIKRLVRK